MKTKIVVNAFLVLCILSYFLQLMLEELCLFTMALKKDSPHDDFNSCKGTTIR